jgi:Asp/Glu/hydantoin racemase
MRELRIVNPNTDTSVTRWLRDEAKRVVGDSFEVIAVNADSGLAAIQTPAEIEVAARAVLSAISAAPRPWGAVVAAFGDPGLSEARALGSTPVVGLGECGLLAAGLGGRRFSIVTLGAAMREAILAKAASLGLSGQLAGVRFLPFSIAELIRDRGARQDAIAAAVRACVEEMRAEAVLLGGAPFAGLAASIAEVTGATVLDGIEASMARLAGPAGMARG